MTNSLDWLLTDDAKGADAQGAADFVRDAVKERVIGEHIDLDQTNQESMARIDAITDVETMGRLQALSDKADRGLFFHTSRVAVDGKYMYSPGEPETIKEWLAQALDGLDTTSSTFYDLAFIAGELIPFMVKHSIAGASLLWAKGYQKKARACVSLLRRLFREAPADLDKEVEKVIGWIMDRNLTKADIEDKVAKKIGRTKPDALLAYEKVEKDDAGWIRVRYNNSIERSLIVRKFGDLLDLHLEAEAKKK